MIVCLLHGQPDLWPHPRDPSFDDVGQEVDERVAVPRGVVEAQQDHLFRHGEEEAGDDLGAHVDGCACGARLPSVVGRHHLHEAIPHRSTRIGVIVGPRVRSPDQQAERVRVPLGVVDGCGDPSTGALGALEVGGLGVHHPEVVPERLHRLVDAGTEEIVLGAEQLVDRRLAHAGFGGDVVDGGASTPAAGELPSGDVEQYGPAQVHRQLWWPPAGCAHRSPAEFRTRR